MAQQITAPPGMFSVVLVDDIEANHFPQGLDFSDRSLALTECGDRNEKRAKEGKDASRYVVIDDRGQERM